jgi:hypothetical protein
VIFQFVKLLAVSWVSYSDMCVCSSSVHHVWKGCVPPGNATHIGTWALEITLWPCGVFRSRAGLISEASSPFIPLMGFMDAEGVSLRSSNTKWKMWVETNAMDSNPRPRISE